MNYARRQQYRRLSHAGKAALGSATTALLGFVLASRGSPMLGGLLALTAVGLGHYARQWRDGSFGRVPVRRRRSSRRAATAAALLGR